MNRDDIIRMATESDLIDSRPPYEKLGDALVRFAELVAAAEREACAALCDGIAERNEADHDVEWSCGNWECAAAIRARSET